MNSDKIPFHRNFIHPAATEYITDVIRENASLYRDKFNQLCCQLIKEKYKGAEVILTSSCTDALTMATLLLNLKQGDEVVIPAYTFPSVANVFVNRGIHIKLADSQADHPNMDPDSFTSLISARTKAVVFMSYGGDSKGIEKIVTIAKEKNIFVIEDAAHSYNSVHHKKHIGTYGDVAAFSFHETKAVSCGQGGMLLINKTELFPQARSIRDHGTNRWQVKEGFVSEYNWTSLGAEFNLPELSAALLYAQLKLEDVVREMRKERWQYYYTLLQPISKGNFILPDHPGENFNFYIFYLLVDNKAEREALISFLKKHEVFTAFHYTGLHRSDYYRQHHEKINLRYADVFSHCLLRLPLYPQLGMAAIENVCLLIKKFYTTAYDTTLV